ncbi:hypothetical protein CDIK_1392 [Cucumispora dikerogammari]|nr:hypothetical protein CDIK_1392 [Cucumispora dikerogammari]
MEDFIKSDHLDRKIEKTHKCKVLKKYIDTFVYKISAESNMEWKHLYSGTLIFSRDGLGLKLIILPRNQPGTFSWVYNNFHYRIINDVLFLKQGSIAYAICVNYKRGGIDKEIVELLKSGRELN